MTHHHHAGSAIVIGGSIAGLLAARVLSEHFAQVIILERDDLTGGTEPRKGIPHAQHAHALLAGGLLGIEGLFPGISQRLVALGAVRGQGRFFSGGGYHARRAGGPGGLFVSRPLLEAEIRARVRGLPNVAIVEHVDARGLAADASQTQVTGVCVVRRDGAGDEEVIPADLVIDCSGRGSRASDWLAALGFPAPEVERVDVGMGYSTRLYRREPEHLTGDVMINIAPSIDNRRACGMLAQEGDRWIVTLAGYFGDHPPTDAQGYVSFARTLPVPDVYDVIHAAEPLTDPVAYRFKANQWRHYEWLDRFPQGFLVLGDAIASFTPVYGQGMTVAALEATALARCLDDTKDDLAARFFAEARAIIAVAWSITVGNDLRLSPQATRPAAMRAIGWYTSRLQLAARYDPVLADAFMQVANFLAPPPSLLRPGIALRVLRGNLHPPQLRRQATTEVPEPARM
ncbi:MAG TPA: FAD-dependent oxidoreductase [Thermomicrobiales bacterium]|nr:FAD-dependent oxidoreductase [Thermomicrobiales bacterium]